MSEFIPEANSFGLYVEQFVQLEKISEPEIKIYGVITSYLQYGQPLILNLKPQTDGIKNVFKSEGNLYLETEKHRYLITFPKIQVTHVYTGMIDGKFFDNGTKKEIPFMCKTPDGRYHLGDGFNDLSESSLDLVVKHDKVKPLKEDICKEWKSRLYVDTNGILFSSLDGFNFTEIGVL